MLRKTFRTLCLFRGDSVRIIISNDFKIHTTIKRNLATQEKKGLNVEDRFGTLALEKNLNFVRDEVEEEPEGEYFGKLDTVRKMKTCLKAHEYDNAKDLLRNMQKREKAPTYAYNLLMSYNAKLGNIEESFKLYNDYKKRGYFIYGPMYTNLFTACANCPRSDIALPIAYKVANYLFESKKHKPNMTNYHALLKALGRHGDLPAAFQLVDRLNNRKSNVTTFTYNMLLEACISDKTSGLRFALLVWHHMLKRNIKPDNYTLKNMAKCAQTCSLGDFELVLDFVKMIVGNEKIKEMDEQRKEVMVSLKLSAESQELNMLWSSNESEMKSLEENSLDVKSFVPLEKVQTVSDALENESHNNLVNRNKIEPNEMLPIEATNQIEENQVSPDVELENSSKVEACVEMELPNLLHPTPTCGSVIDFDDLSKPENRFMLFGGLKGFFKVVDHFNVQPDKTLFSILVNCILRTKEAEEELMEFMKKYKIKPDVQFINILLRRRLLYIKDYSFQDCVDSVNECGVSPNVDTIRIFAEACRFREEGKKCIELTRNLRITFSPRFMYALMKNASANCDVFYVSDILTVAKEEGVHFNPKTLALIESTLNRVKVESGEN